MMSPVRIIEDCAKVGMLTGTEPKIHYEMCLRRENSPGHPLQQFYWPLSLYIVCQGGRTIYKDTVRKVELYYFATHYPSKPRRSLKSQILLLWCKKICTRGQFYKSKLKRGTATGRVKCNRIASHLYLLASRFEHDIFLGHH